MESREGNRTGARQAQASRPVTNALAAGSTGGMNGPRAGKADNPVRHGRPRRLLPVQAGPPTDLETLARQRPTLPVVELPRVLGHVPGFSSRSAVFRRARAGTLPGLVRGQGHRAYVVTAVLVRHLLGDQAA
jgi:hypothetical protein